MNSNVPKRQKLVHTHRTSCRLDWPRGFGALNSSRPSWIFTSVLVGFNLRSYYPLPLRSEYPFILHQRVTENLSAMWLSTFVISAAELRYVTKIALPQVFLCVNRRLVAAQKLSAVVWTQAKTPRIQSSLSLSLAPSGLREEDGLKNTHWCLSTGFPNLVYVW